MKIMKGLLLICGVLKLVWCDKQDTTQNLSPGKSVGDLNEGGHTDTRINKRSANQNLDKRDTYSVLDGLSQLPVITPDRRIYLNTDFPVDGPWNVMPKRSWNTPPFLSYLYSKKRYFSKRSPDDQMNSNNNILGYESDPYGILNRRAEDPYISQLGYYDIEDQNDREIPAQIQDYLDKRSWGTRPIKFSKNRKLMGFGKRYAPEIGFMEYGDQTW